MIKKFFPALLFVMVFAGVVAISIGLDLINNSKYMLTSKYEFYNKIYSENIFDGRNNEEFSLKDLNSKIVIINFWASWCSVCSLENPTLIELRKKFTQGELEIVSINTDDVHEIYKAQKIMKKMKFNFPVIFDHSKKIQTVFNVSSLPFSVVYIDGIATGAFRGMKDFNSIEMIETFQEHIVMTRK